MFMQMLVPLSQFERLFQLSAPLEGSTSLFDNIIRLYGKLSTHLF